MMMMMNLILIRNILGSSSGLLVKVIGDIRKGNQSERRVPRVRVLAVVL